jgi:hypothetical protein
MTYNLFSKSNRKAQIKPAGAGYYFAVRQGAIESVGARNEGEFLPEPLRGDGVQGNIQPKQIYGVLRMSGLMLEAGKGNVAAFVDSKSDTIMDTYKALVSDLNRQCHGDGFGALATLSAASDAPATGATWTITCANDTGVRYLRKGMIVDFYASGGAIDQSAVTSRISSINPNSQTAEMEAIAATGSGGSSYQAFHPITAARTYTISTETVPSGSIVVRYGARDVAFATTDTPVEMTGLLGMYDDGTLITTFEGINTTNDPEFKANILSNSSVNRELSIDLMLAAMDMTAARADSRADIIRMGLGQRRKYFALLAPDIRFAPQKPMGGYEKLAFSQDGSVSIIIDVYTQPNRLFFEPDGCIKKYELTPVGWGGFRPNEMHWREDYDEGTMFLRTYTNLGVEKRNELTLLADLTEPSSAPF